MCRGSVRLLRRLCDRRLRGHPPFVGLSLLSAALRRALFPAYTLRPRRPLPDLARLELVPRPPAGLAMHEEPGVDRRASRGGGPVARLSEFPASHDPSSCADASPPEAVHPASQSRRSDPGGRGRPPRRPVPRIRTGTSRSPTPRLARRWYLSYPPFSYHPRSGGPPGGPLHERS